MYSNSSNFRLTLETSGVLHCPQSTQVSAVRINVNIDVSTGEIGEWGKLLASFT